MNLKNTITDFVEKNNFFPGQILDYDQYLSMHKDSAFILNGFHRGLKDLISISAWMTSEEGIQYITYLPMNIREMHCAKIRFSNGKQTARHTHNYIELIYVIEGTFSMQIARKINTFHSNEICLVNTETVHSEFLYAQNTIVLCLGIDEAFFEQYKLSAKSEDYTFPLKKLINQKRTEYLYMLFLPINHKMTKTASIFELIMDELMDELPGKKKLLIGYVERIIDFLTKEYHINIAQIDKKELHMAIVMSICEYIRNTLPAVSVTDISKKFNYNPDYLNRLFKKEMKMNLSEYIQETRLQYAYDLLISTDLSIEAIIHQSGYHNMGFFYQKFRKRYGTTPHNIRSKL